jgi:Domain of unknown function (DUF6985)
VQRIDGDDEREPPADALDRAREQARVGMPDQRDITAGPMINSNKRLARVARTIIIAECARATGERGASVFGLFKSQPFRDDVLGELRRAGGYWKGSVFVAPCGAFRLALAGSREAPAPTAVALARELPDRFTSLTPAIQASLFEHYAPYKESCDSGEETGISCPIVASPEKVWPFVTPAHVLVTSLEGISTIEVAFKVAWDVEHTVAARFRNWQFIELNGSVRGQ